MPPQPASSTAPQVPPAPRALHAPNAPNAPFVRLWQGLLAGRVLIASCLLALHILLITTGGHSAAVNPLLWLVCLGYLTLAVVLRGLAGTNPPAPQLGLHWLPVIGVDIAAITLLQWLQTGPLNYSALLAIPILIAAVLGSLLLALTTTASVTLLLLGSVIWQSVRGQLGDDRVIYQTGFACAGYFVIAYLTHELARRVRREYTLALQSRIQAQNQEQINALITRQLGDGVLVVGGHPDGLFDGQLHVQQANPAALRLLGLPAQDNAALPLALNGHAGWHELHEAVAQSMAQGQSFSGTLHVQAPGQHGSTGVRVRTWLTEVPVPPALDALNDVPQRAPAPAAQCLCLVFLRDLREMEAQIRTEKLAAMGRMSSAVAHEIRNPLAAIVQANALLAEDDTLDAGQLGLCRIVAQNARRLDRTVEDILNAARVQQQAGDAPMLTEPLALDAQVGKICQEWLHQDSPPRHATLQLRAAGRTVLFDGEHLRRILVNLMDNAQRYRSDAQRAHTLQVSTSVQAAADSADGDGATGEETIWLQVWSDGSAIEPSVQRHLFEPFFSSESRSSGLGLYLSRTLCQQYGASIDYLRLVQPTPAGEVAGNAFRIVFRAHAPLTG